MNKDELWKAMNEPAVKNCQNCVHIKCNMDNFEQCEGMKFKPLIWRADFYQSWEYDGKSK